MIKLKLHMVGYMLNIYNGGGTVIFRIFFKSGSEEKNDRMLGMWSMCLYKVRSGD